MHLSKLQEKHNRPTEKETTKVDPSTKNKRGDHVAKKNQNPSGKTRTPITQRGDKQNYLRREATLSKGG